MTASLELRSLAETVALWVDDVIGVPAIYIFGSRVRGDNRPDSDVDLCVFLTEWKPTAACLHWWKAQHESDFTDLKAALPGPPKLHLETWDAAHTWVKAARADPLCAVLRIRKAVCLWTPPKTYL